MQRFKALSISTVLLVLGSIGLSACGNDPTPTVAPPTATSKPAATSTPKIQATPTAASQAGRAATSDEIDAITESLNAAKDLKTYHFDIEVQPSTFITQPVTAQGDYEAPDLTYVEGTIGKEKFEHVIIGDVVFEKNSSGKYVVMEEKDQSNSDPLSSFNSENFITSANPLADIDQFAEVANDYKYVGDLQVGGVKVKHFTFAIDLEKMAGDQGMGDMDVSDLDLGGGGFYIDDSKNVLYGVEYNLNVAAFFELIARAFSSFGGTPTPGGAKPTPIPRLDVNMIMKITKHDDTSIHVPVTEEMRQLAEASPTEDPFELPTAETIDTPEVDETPIADETPEVDATPEADTTPEAFPTFAGLPSGDGKVHTGKMGEPVDAGWARITVNSATTKVESYLDPAAGNEYISIKITIENVSSDEPENISSLLAMKLKYADGTEAQQTFGANSDNLIDGESPNPLPKGDKITGVVNYEIKKGSTGLTFEYFPYPIFDEETIISVPIEY